MRPLPLAVREGRAASIGDVESRRVGIDFAYLEQTAITAHINNI
jgi:hypothetical protein